MLTSQGFGRFSKSNFSNPKPPNPKPLNSKPYNPKPLHPHHSKVCGARPLKAKPVHKPLPRHPLAAAAASSLPGDHQRRFGV